MRWIGGTGGGGGRRFMGLLTAASVQSDLITRTWNTAIAGTDASQTLSVICEH
jgi:hypothetical protein